MVRQSRRVRPDIFQVQHVQIEGKVDTELNAGAVSRSLLVVTFKGQRDGEFLATAPDFRYRSYAEPCGCQRITAAAA
jgi:hypothetical protein